MLLNHVWYPHSWSSVIDVMMLELWSLFCDLPMMSYLRLGGHTGLIHWVLPLLMRHQACKQTHNFCLQLLLIAARCFLWTHNSGYLHLSKLKYTDIKKQQESTNSSHVCVDNEFSSLKLTHSQIRYTVLYMALSTYSSASEIFVLSCCVTTLRGISGKAQYIRPWFSNTTTGHKLFFSVTLTSNAG